MNAFLLLSTVAALGDSVTLGVRRDGSVVPEQTFVALLQSAMNEKVVNAGIGGDNTRQMLARIDADVLAHAPRAVIVMAGLNDAARVDSGGVERSEPRIPIEEYESNLRKIVQAARASGARIALLTPNPMTRKWPYEKLPFYQVNDINEGLVPYADAARRVARTEKVCMADLYAGWISEPKHRNWLPDGIHPNPEGHLRIARLILDLCGSALGADPGALARLPKSPPAPKTVRRVQPKPRPRPAKPRRKR